MSVAITAQVASIESFAASSQATAPAQAGTQAGQGTGATPEQGLVDFFVKARLDADGQVAQATNSAASSGEMVGKLREFIDRAHQSDVKNHATRLKQKEAAARAETDLATLDTFSVGQSGPVGKFAPLNQYASVQPSVGLHPGPASEPLGRGPGLASQGRLSAMADKMTNDLMESAIHNM